MFKTLINGFKVANIRKKIFFTLMILLIYRIGAYITVPGINASALSRVSHSGLVSMLNMFSGGGLTNYSLFAMGVSPYITAQIVIQMLQMNIVPQFTEWSKAGARGRQKLNQATRWLAIILAFLQSVGITAGFNTLSSLHLVQNPSISTYIEIGLILTGGSMLTVWMGDQITDKGIGQGLSIIIFAGIIADTPNGIAQMWQEYVEGETGTTLITSLIFVAAIILAVILIVTFVTWFHDAERRIPIQYTRRAASSGKDSYLPLKVNSSNVIPVIFAASFISTPGTLLMFFQSKYGGTWLFKVLSDIFNMQTMAGAIVYTVMIVIFTFFYSFVAINPHRLAKNLTKQGAYITNVWPGKDTEDYISSLLMRLNTVGALFLGIISLIPLIAQNVWNLSDSIGLGGSSLIIVCGVAIDSMKQIRGLTMKKSYVGFIQRKRPANLKPLS